MPVGDESSEDEAQMKWEEQQIKKAVKLSQVTHAFLTLGRCFLLIGKTACSGIQSYLLPALLLERFLESCALILQKKGNKK